MKLSSAQQHGIQTYQQTGTLDGIHKNTRDALVRRGLFIESDGQYRIGQAYATVVSEVIDGPVRQKHYDSSVRSNLKPTRHAGHADYGYWDRARRGMVRGLEISGLYLKPLCSKIASWVMDTPLQFRIPDNPAAETALNDWWSEHHTEIITAYEESLALADMYLVLNADETLTQIPPNAVTPLVDERDYSQRTGWQIEDVYEHPTRTNDRMSIRNDYTTDGRTITYLKNGLPFRPVQRYRNLTGLLPVIHIANNRASDDLFGRAEAEPLIPALHRYGEILDAAMDGNIIQGRPTPTISGLGDPENVDQVMEMYSTKKHVQNADGTTDTYNDIEFVSDSLVILGGNGKLDYVSPGSFTKDTETLLQVLFYLLIQHSETPEFVWGGAIQGSRASTDSQLPVYAKFIQKKRAQARHWILTLATTFLALRGLSDMRVRTDATPKIVWGDLIRQDAALTHSVLTTLHDRGLIEDLTFLQLAPVQIEDTEGTLKRARAEAQQRENSFDARAEDDLQTLEKLLAGQDTDTPDNPDSDSDTPDNTDIQTARARLEKRESHATTGLFTHRQNGGYEPAPLAGSPLSPHRY